MMHAMRSRGGGASALSTSDLIAIAATRQPWELQGVYSGSLLTLETPDVIVAADASLYYREELRRQIEARGVVVSGGTSTELILAAYRAWGDRCAEHLEGDFAFIVWDRQRRQLCAARDFTGTRTLFYAQRSGVLLIASTVGALVAHPAGPREMDLDGVAAIAAGLFGSIEETSYRDAHALRAGWTLIARPGTHAVLRPHWSLPDGEGTDSRSFEDAAEELRELLEAAVHQRLDRGAATSVWLSGGWDSTSVFGVGSRALQPLSDRRTLLPVSVSYPVGDPGREDELIAATAARWSSPVTWIESAAVPLLDNPSERAAERDGPFGHPFEMWLRALARGSRSIGARIALGGAGGDQLFQVSEVFLADLLKRGHWLELAREWREKGLKGAGFRMFFHLAVQPHLTPRMLHAARLVRGRPLLGYMEHPLPVWIDPTFARQHHLEERDVRYRPPRGRSSHVDYELCWYLTHPFYPHIFGEVAALAMDEGVEVRSPLMDGRIVRFAGARPRSERSSGRETKRLLRRAVRDVLPPEVLAARQRRTGILDRYFAQGLRAGLPQLLRNAAADLRLADVGIVDRTAFRRSCELYCSAPEHDGLGRPLFFTMMAEWWLRAHERTTSTGEWCTTGPSCAAAIAGRA